MTSATENLELDADGQQLVAQYRLAVEVENVATEKREDLRTKLLALLGPALHGSVDGNVIVSRKHVLTRRFDSSSFKQHNPEIYDSYLTPSEYDRVVLP